MLWPQPGSRAHSPTPAQPESPQNPKASPAPVSQLEELGPKEATSQPTNSTVSFRGERAPPPPAQSHPSPYLPGATGPPGRSTEPAAPLRCPRCLRVLGGAAAGEQSSRPGLAASFRAGSGMPGAGLPHARLDPKGGWGWTVARSPDPQPGFPLLVSDLAVSHQLSSASADAGESEGDGTPSLKPLWPHP